VAATRFELEVWTEGQDEPAQVRADQRDITAFEAASKIGFTRAMDEQPITFFRYIAWHALRRTGQIDVKTALADWSDRTESVDPVEDEPTPVDPGNTAAPDETSSISH